MGKAPFGFIFQNAWFMSCGCENRERLSDLERMRDLAKRAAKIEHSVYVLYEKDGVFGFVPDGEDYIGDMVEYVWY